AGHAARGLPRREGRDELLGGDRVRRAGEHARRARELWRRRLAGTAVRPAARSLPLDLGPEFGAVGAVFRRARRDQHLYRAHAPCGAPSDLVCRLLLEKKTREVSRVLWNRSTLVEDNRDVA